MGGSHSAEDEMMCDDMFWGSSSRFTSALMALLKIVGAHC
jgi:hypothetical protein